MLWSLARFELASQSPDQGEIHIPITTISTAFHHARLNSEQIIAPTLCISPLNPHADLQSQLFTMFSWIYKLRSECYNIMFQLGLRQPETTYLLVHEDVPDGERQMGSMYTM